jgi:hypothetical protein
VSARLPFDARRRPNPDEERIAEIKLLFLEQGCKMFAPRRFGGSKDLSGTWVVRYVRDHGAVDAYGTGGTPLEATEDAWGHFPAEAARGTRASLA